MCPPPPLYLTAFFFYCNLGNIVSLTGLVQVFLNSECSTLTCLLLPLMAFTFFAGLADKFNKLHIPNIKKNQQILQFL